MRWKLKLSRSSRKWHYFLALCSALPVLVIVGSGLLLQVKKEFAWIQPPTQRGQQPGLGLNWEELIEIAKSQPQANIQSWDDIDRLDVRPSRGLIKLQAQNRWELQIDANSGEILSSAYRRSDLIESIHDGSFFHDHARLWLFLPAGIALLLLWVSGIAMAGLMIWNRAQMKKNRKHRKSPRPRAA